MHRAKLALAAIIGLATVSPAMAAPTWIIGNDTNGSSTVPLASAPNSDAKSVIWNTATANYDHLVDHLSTLTNLGSFQSPLGPLTVPFGWGINAAISATGTAQLNDTATANGHYAAPSATGSNYLLTATGGLTFKFGTPISGFSFYATDLGDISSGTTAITLKLAGATVATAHDVACVAGAPNCVPISASSQNGAVSFVGVYDTTLKFDELVFTATGGGDVMGISDMTIAVPEPASFALLGAGMLGIGMIRRRSAKQNRD